MTTRRDCLLALAGAMAPAKRGAVAFHYEAVFTPAALNWYTRFDVVVTGAVLSPQQVSALRLRGSTPVAYEWSSAFYPGDPASASEKWQERVRRNASAWLLSAAPAGGGAAASGKGALWYDFGNAELREARAEYLASLAESSEYGGYFFDTLGFEQLPAPMRDAFHKRHPGADYNRLQGAFLGALRERLAKGIVFLNQGYRHAEHMLPHADFDLTESYFTASAAGATRFRAWHDPAAAWEAIRTPMEQLVMPAASRFPRVRFVHVNYASGDAATVRRALRYSFAAAKLWNHESYVIMPGAYAQEQDEIYMRDPGRPKAPGYKEAGQLAWREFEHGIVALNTGPTETAIPGSALRIPARSGVFPARATRA